MKRAIIFLLFAVLTVHSCQKKTAQTDHAALNDSGNQTPAPEESVAGKNTPALYTSIPPEYSTLSAEQLNEMGLKSHRNREYTESYRFFSYATLADTEFYMGFFNIACTLSLLNQVKEAVSALSKALALNETWVIKNLGDADLNNLRKSAEYSVLILSIAPLPDYGTWKTCNEDEVPAWAKDSAGNSASGYLFAFGPDLSLHVIIYAGPQYEGTYTISGNTIQWRLTKEIQDSPLPEEGGRTETDIDRTGTATITCEAPGFLYIENAPVPDGYYCSHINK